MVQTILVYDLFKGLKEEFGTKRGRPQPQLRDDHDRMLDPARWQHVLPALGAHVAPAWRRGLPLAIRHLAK